MTHDDERDFAEEEANAALMRDEHDNDDDATARYYTSPAELAELYAVGDEPTAQAAIDADDATVPADFPVRVLLMVDDVTVPGDVIMTCGTCGRSWDDSEVTAYTPAPAGRCPFEGFHDDNEHGDNDRRPRYYYAEPDETADDRAWRAAYGIAWVGASNTAGTALSIHGVIVDLRSSGMPWREVDTHPAVRAMVGHLAYLTGQGAGPTDEDLRAVEAHGVTRPVDRS